MSDLRPIQQVKENPPDFTLRIRTPEERKEYKFRKIAETFNVTYDQVIQWEKDGHLPKSFTCPKCEENYFEPMDQVFIKRCKPCSRNRSAYRRAKKWKSLIMQEWLKRKYSYKDCKYTGRRKIHHKKFATLKFITLTVENFLGEGLDHDQVKKLFMRPFRKYIKEANKRGWLIGGLYAYECTTKQTRQEQWFSGRDFTKPGQRTKTPKDNSDESITEYHPHVHIIGIGPRVDQSEHRQLWNECINTPTRNRVEGRAEGIVRSKVARQFRPRVGGVHIEAVDSIGKSLWYIVEYIKKSTLQGRNRNSFGILRGVELDDNPVLNLQELDKQR